MLWPRSGPLRLAVALRPRLEKKSPASHRDRMNVFHLPLTRQCRVPGTVA